MAHDPELVTARPHLDNIKNAIYAVTGEIDGMPHTNVILADGALVRTRFEYIIEQIQLAVDALEDGAEGMEQTAAATAEAYRQATGREPSTSLLQPIIDNAVKAVKSLQRSRQILATYEPFIGPRWVTLLQRVRERRDFTTHLRITAQEVVGILSEFQFSGDYGQSEQGSFHSQPSTPRSEGATSVRAWEEPLSIPGSRAPSLRNYHGPSGSTVQSSGRPQHSETSSTCESSNSSRRGSRTYENCN
jgi:hypothetical protein